jgi:hypothetical protein
VNSSILLWNYFKEYLKDETILTDIDLNSYELLDEEFLLIIKSLKQLIILNNLLEKTIIRRIIFKIPLITIERIPQVIDFLAFFPFPDFQNLQKQLKLIILLSNFFEKKFNLSFNLLLENSPIDFNTIEDYNIINIKLENNYNLIFTSDYCFYVDNNNNLIQLFTTTEI